MQNRKAFLSHQRKKAADKYPDMDKAVADMMNMQYDAEHSENPSVDMSAHPTALMLATLFSTEAHDEIQKESFMNLAISLADGFILWMQQTI